MMLTKLKAAVAALVLGVITAGAIVSAQPPGGGRAGPSEAARKAPRPPQPVAARGGNIIVDWIPGDGKGGKKVITVDPTKHCIYMPGSKSLTADERPNDGVLFIGLERGKTYTVTAAGEAFMTDHTGVDADPFAGVVLFYGTDEEDCYAIRQTVLAPGKSITFRSPWNIKPTDGVSLTAFFLDTWPGHPKRGSYTLTITEAGEHADLKQIRDRVRWFDKLYKLEQQKASKPVHDGTAPPSDAPRLPLPPENRVPKPAKIQLAQ
jgi:hypothetical protein